MRKAIFFLSMATILGLARASADNPEADIRSIGINFFTAQLDYCEDRLFADAMKTSREWVIPGNYGDQSKKVSVDENGWPTVDAEVPVWHGIDRMNGTYRLEGYCASRPTITAGFGGGEIRDFAYANGKFSADFVYSSTGKDGLLLTFRNTGGGVRNVKLMRPISVGSRTSYPPSAVFTNQAKRLVEKVSVVRFLWPVDAWNGPWQKKWSDRVSPTYCSFNRGSGTPNVGWAGKGMAWEYAIQFCNETGRDMWLAMPIGADDDYIASLARLVKEKYKLPHGKVYWEYSNEATWDGGNGGACSAYLKAEGRDEALRGGPVGYDGQREDLNVLAARYYAKRAAEMSVIWRSVWGDADMMTRIRPVASGQLSYDTQLTWGLDFIHNWFNNGDGKHVLDPHPVNYFFYGCGGSHYTKDDPDRVIDGVTEIADFERFEEEESCIAKMYGLKRCAYEGGVWTSESDYLLPRIKDAMIRYQELYDAYDGELLNYYVTTGGEDDGTALGFTKSVFNLNTPKFDALDQLFKSPRGKITAGKLAPCEIEGADFSANSVSWEHPAAGGAETRGGGQLDEWRTYKAYLFRTEKRGTYGISLEYINTTGAIIEVMVDGVIIAKETLSGASSRWFNVQLSPGLHGIRIKKLDPGFFMLNKVKISG